ncbi:MAG: septum formation protein Maf [Candidatus Latescibacterota bacterium]|nr:MAG: septum formation protein Maf [Candidatus Latescibacterota bacterium]
MALASSSPRRAELLLALGVPFRVIPPGDGTEEGGEGGAGEIALRHAEAKARSVLDRAGDAVVLSADTLVAGEGRILGKPGDPAEAASMLRFLSGGAHEVVTAVFAIDARSGRTASGVETTRVVFRDLAPAEIEAYIATGEPFDKAGAYGVQGTAGLFVRRIEGCYFNVVGLPLVRTRAVLLELLEARRVAQSRPRDGG